MAPSPVPLFRKVEAVVVVIAAVVVNVLMIECLPRDRRERGLNACFMTEGREERQGDNFAPFGREAGFAVHMDKDL